MEKTIIMGGLGTIGAWIASFFGGWNMGVIILLAFMGIDFVSGLLVAGIFKRSGKSENGALESRAGWKGLCRKGMTLAVVLIAFLLDTLMETSFIRDATVIAYMVNELLSIAENAGLMGAPMPDAIKRAIEVLSHKEDNHSGR